MFKTTRHVIELIKGNSGPMKVSLDPIESYQRKCELTFVKYISRGNNTENPLYIHSLRNEIDLSTFCKKKIPYLCLVSQAKRLTDDISDGQIFERI